MKPCLMFWVLVLLGGAIPSQAQTAYRPTVQLTDLLGLRFFPQSGLFQFDGLQIAFPKAGETYSLELRRAGGAVIYKVGLDLQEVSGFPAFGWLNPQERGSDKFKLSEGGKYELAVRMGSQEIGVVAFEARATDSGDAFNPGKTFRLVGHWDRWAYLYTRDGEPNARLYVVGWVTDSEFGPNRSDRWVTVQITKGGSVLCKSEVFVDAPHWSRYRFDVARPNSNAPCTLADLQKADGEYGLEFRSKARLLRKFNFRVANKQIQRIPRNTLPYLSANWGGIPSKLVNSDLQLQETFWFEASR
ncbi:MAG: hypothetical protein KatS3mg070_0134 [Meiothermus sp.]|uniref:hypothetical protein n=1 Tax=Meiothermus sp. TaxID=1955249 RepID=UPI0021DCE1BA|nr:hypothetical protein [Meiothermus sp.]GIW26771.1 MAG: hypothetical protein KatS3mg070_0134 [Meiothermus sp.]